MGAGQGGRLSLVLPDRGQGGHRAARGDGTGTALDMDMGTPASVCNRTYTCALFIPVAGPVLGLGVQTRIRQIRLAPALKASPGLEG